MTSKATVKVNGNTIHPGKSPTHGTAFRQKSRRPGVDSHFESIDILLGT